MNEIAVVCVAALGILLFGLGLLISGLRGKGNQYFGYEADPTNLLYKVVRAHGNTAEYAAFFAVLMLYLGAHSPEPWVTWTMVSATASRYLFVAGFIFCSTVARPNPVRFVGALGTYICGIALCIALTRSF
jgi:uncharacterized membrane protein YecN with MAPEG domain